jgi:hypothetical protein
VDNSVELSEDVPGRDRAGVPTWPAAGGASAHTGVDGWGLKVPLGGFLENALVKGKIRYRSLEPGIFAFELFEPFGLI